MENKDVAPELVMLIKSHMQRGRTDEISLNALAKRWTKWFDELPEPSVEQVRKGREIHAIDESRRLRALESTVIEKAGAV